MKANVVGGFAARVVAKSGRDVFLEPTPGLVVSIGLDRVHVTPEDLDLVAGLPVRVMERGKTGSPGRSRKEYIISVEE